MAQFLNLLYQGVEFDFALGLWEGMRQILYHFRDAKFLLICHNLPDIHVGYADVKVISYFGEEGFGSCVLVEVVELSAETVVVCVEVLAIEWGNILLFAGEDEFEVGELIFQQFYFILELV